MFRKKEGRRYTEKELIEKAKKETSYESSTFDPHLLDLCFMGTGLQPKKVDENCYELVAAGY